MVRVAICDDHAIVRKGLVMILSQCGEISVAVEAENFGDLRKKLSVNECDVLIIDIEMPGKSGIEAVALLRQENPKMGAIVLSMHPEGHYAVRALRAGAMGYLNKASAPELLVDAVMQVSRGRRFVTPEVSIALADAVVDDRGETPHLQLSDREFQVLRMIAQGAKLGAIADTLSISPKTVSVYRARMLEKLGLMNNVDIARYAVKHGLVDPPA